MRFYYVYILASRARVHRSGVDKRSFVSQYHVTRLVYWEDFTDIKQAIAREKQLKGWRRAKKIRLIEGMNPNWIDLAPPDLPGPSLRSG